MTHHRFFSTLALAVALMVFTTSLVNAQATTQQAPQAVTLMAVPPRLGDEYSLVVRPGETIQTSVEVRNPSETTMTIETIARDFYIAEDGETPIPVEEETASPKWQLSRWLTLSPSSNVLPAKGSATITITITAPADALPGGRYAMILHSPVQDDADAQGSGAQINARVGTLLYVVVEGEMTEGAIINGFTFPGLTEGKQIPYSFTIANQSSYHLRPQLTLTITNMLGKTVYEQEIEAKNIFPDSSRDFSGEWTPEGWSLGIYKAKLTGTYGANFASGQLHELSSEVSFWILPWRIIVMAILLIVAAIALVIISRRRYQKLLTSEQEKVRLLDEKLKQAGHGSETTTTSDQPQPEENQQP